MQKIEKKVKVANKQGIHARPAAMFVQIANKYASQITVARDHEEVNGKSIMGILMLGADYQAELTLKAEGLDAKAAIEELEAFLGKES